MKPVFLAILLTAVASAMPTTSSEIGSSGTLKIRDGTTGSDSDFALKAKRDGATDDDTDYWLKVRHD
ncbi:hypothetical protein Hte_012386 [Hypoxylon texense]